MRQSMRQGESGRLYNNFFEIEYPTNLGGPGQLGRSEVELSESPAAHAYDTNTRSGGPSVNFDLSPVAFLASWNTSAGVR